MLNIRGKNKTEKFVGELRKSKITTTAGCGALVEFPGFSGIMGGQNLWDQRFKPEMKIHEKTLEKLLGKEFFVQVVSQNDGGEYKRTYDIPVRRFPRYYYCPNCNELDRAEILASNYSSRFERIEPLLCNHCNKELIASRFVMACLHGHIEDFPYVWWVHKGKNCEHPRLKLINKGASGGLESIMIFCESCNSMRTMAGCLSNEALSGIKCRGNSPWLGENSKCECGQNVRVLMRGANNLYYPEKISALTIPPWSNDIQIYLNEYESSFEMAFGDGIPDEYRELLVKGVFEKNELAQLLRCDFNLFFQQLKLRFCGVPEELSISDMEHNEYLALSGNAIDEKHFKTEKVEVKGELGQLFSTISLIKRLREVEVLTGFKRIDADKALTARISSKVEKWLPATEMIGEGIFFKVNRKFVEDWMVKNGTHYIKMRARYKQKKNEEKDEAFVLVHTLSHLLIKELAFNSGYDSSSIREKIYVNTTKDEWELGILVYTAVTSSDGSLGGLVRLGQIEYLTELVESMLDRAKWCSNDPICIEAEEQGLFGLNYAACYACCLIPETSCRYQNVLLDRNAVISSIN